MAADLDNRTPTPRRRRRAVRSIACYAVVVAGFLGVILLKPGGDFTSMVIGSLIVTASATLAGAGCLRAARRSAGKDRLGWALLTAGMWSWTAGNIVWLGYVLIRPEGPPMPSVADALFFGLIPLTLAGAAALGGLGKGGFRILLDGLIISGSFLVLSYVTPRKPDPAPHR